MRIVYSELGEIGPQKHGCNMVDVLAFSVLLVEVVPDAKIGNLNFLGLAVSRHGRAGALTTAIRARFSRAINTNENREERQHEKKMMLHEHSQHAMTRWRGRTTPRDDSRKQTTLFCILTQATNPRAKTTGL